MKKVFRKIRIILGIASAVDIAVDSIKSAGEGLTLGDVQDAVIPVLERVKDLTGPEGDEFLDRIIERLG